VLLVDGSADVRGTIREMLADVSCNIAEARDSREGLRVIADREQTPGGGFELLWGSSWAASESPAAGGDCLVGARGCPAIASRPEMREIAVALKRADNVDRLLGAIQAALDDPLAFVEILDD